MPLTPDERRARQAAYQRAYRERHPERERARKAATPPEKQREYAARSRAKHPETARARHARWREGHRTESVLRQQARRAAEEAGDLTIEQWEAILDEFAHRCAYCSAEGDLHLEHMTPLSRGGRHTASNVVPACPRCNLSKGAKTIFEFLAAA